MRIVPRVIAQLLAGLLFLGVLLVGSPAEAATRPSAPRAAAAKAYDHAVKVTWQRPLNVGGAAIDRYAVQRWNPSTQQWRTVRSTTAAARSWTNTGLVNGRTYYFRVLAHNRVGWSPASRQVSAVPRGVPGGVPYAEAVTHDSELRLQWGNAAPNGAAIDHYAAEISTDGATWTRLTKVTGLVASFSNLEPGERYWFRVRAHNAAGYGTPGGSGPYRGYTGPSAVRDLTVVPGDASAQLQWTAPPSDTATVQTTGHRPAVSYDIEVREAEASTWTDIGNTTTTSWLATGLTNGVNYSFRITGISDLDTNDKVFPGEPATISYIAGTPGAVGTPVQAWNDSSGQFDLVWSEPVAIGAGTLDHYEVTAEAGSPVAIVPAAEPFLSPVDGLVGHSVRACNTAELCGPWASTAALPGQPTALFASLPEMAGVQWQVPLTWAAPSDGAEVASYRVERSEDAGVSWEELAEVTELAYVDMTPAPGTTYDYRVIAVGPSGEGQPSSVAPATTGAAQSLSADPSSLSIFEGDQVSVTISLAVASVTEVVVLLSSLDPAAARILVDGMPVDSVVIPAGQTTASVTVEGVVDNDIDEELTSFSAMIDESTSVAVGVMVSEPT